METVWNVEHVQHFSKVKSPATYDIVIVGGGLTALLTCYFLKDSNLNIALMCDKNFTQSASARSNAKITTVNTSPYFKIANNFGFDKAMYFYNDKRDAMMSYVKIINDHHISCDLTRSSSFLYATTDQGKEDIINEITFFNNVGIPFVHHSETLENFIEIKNAYEFKNEYSFNPVKFMESLLDTLKKYNNIHIFENSSVSKITNKYLIANNHEIKFDKVVVATHYPPFKVLGQFPLKMYQEKATLCTFKTTTQTKNMYVSVDENNVSIRPYKDDSMILVANNHRTGEKSLSHLDLETYAKKNFENVTDFKTYSNQDCVTFDKLPFIDTACFVLPNVYVATGYNLFGITTSMLASKHIARKILNGTPFPKIYSRNRVNIKAQKQEFKKHFSTVVYELTHKNNYTDELSRENIKDLKEGEGFTFFYNKKRIGVSRQNGELLFVENKCTHLGCPLHYNKDSQTWDCRCHGSSYKPNGEFIFAPTNKNLERLNLKELIWDKHLNITKTKRTFLKATL